MQVVAAVFADFEHNWLGGPARLEQPLLGRGVLAHTLRRLARVGGIDRRLLVIQPRDAARAAQALADCPAADMPELLSVDDGARPRRALIAAARKWNLHAWRGSPQATTFFDEFVDPLAVGRVLDATRADAALILDAHHAAFDPLLATALVEHYRLQVSETRFSFTQAPPGLAGIVLSRAFVRELLEEQSIVGLRFAYRPEAPRSDPITKAGCLRVPREVSQTPARFCADLAASTATLERALADCGVDADAATLCAWQRAASPDPLPRLVEIELTTRDPLPESRLRPRGARVKARELCDLAALERVARELAAFDDRLVVVGGHGDPLQCAQLPQALAILRRAGVCGIAVRTPLVDLSDEHLEALFAQRVDLIEVQLDANSAAPYAAVHGADAFERVLGNVRRIEALRVERRAACPIPVCSLIRHSATLPELEGFYDRWTAAHGWAVVRGFATFGGALPEDTLRVLSPPTRTACRRVAQGLTLLADGAATVCDQDLNAVQSLGDWRSSKVRELWSGTARNDICNAHAAGEWRRLAACAECDGWHG